MVGPDYPEDDDKDIELSEEDLLMMDVMESMEQLLDAVKSVAVVYTTADDNGGPEDSGCSDDKDKT